MNKTTFDKKCEILADLWLEYKDDETFEDFIGYNDLGLPLAYCLANGIITTAGVTETAKGFVNEAFELLLTGLEMEDEGFENLDQLLCE
jgi:hypothetical protein